MIFRGLFLESKPCYPAKGQAPEVPRKCLFNISIGTAVGATKLASMDEFLNGREKIEEGAGP